jgi:hypothetical protein
VKLARLFVVPLAAAPALALPSVGNAGAGAGVLRRHTVSDAAGLARALAAAASGSVIRLAAGTYTGTVIRTVGSRTPAVGEGIYIGSAQSNWCPYTSCQPDRGDRDVTASTCRPTGTAAV